jgi:hypothetical protein
VGVAEVRRKLFEKIVDAMSRQDWNALEALHHPDYVEEMPQSRERIRGANSRKILENYPGGIGGEGVVHAEMLAPEDRWAMTPTFTVVNTSGASDMFTAIIRARYPDGTHWYMVSIGRIKDGKLWRATTFYAPELPAPEWRKQWVESMDEPEPAATDG